MSKPLTFIEIKSSSGKIEPEDLEQVRSRAAKKESRLRAAVPHHVRTLRPATQLLGSQDASLAGIRIRQWKPRRQKAGANKEPNHGQDTDDKIRLTGSTLTKSSRLPNESSIALTSTSPFASPGTLLGTPLPGQTHQEYAHMIQNSNCYVDYMESSDELFHLPDNPRVVRDIYHAQLGARKSAMLYAALLSGIATKETRIGFYLNHENAMLVSVALRQVSDAMTPKRVLDEMDEIDIMSAPSLLALYETIRGGDKVRTHMAGMFHVINAFGGVKSIESPSLLMHICFTDLMMSVYLNQSPTTVSLACPILHSFDSPTTLNNTSIPFLSSPLLIAQTFEEAEVVNNFVSSTSVQILSDAWNFFVFRGNKFGLQGSETGRSPPYVDPAPTHVTESPSRRVVPLTEAYLNRAIHVTSMVWYRATIGGIPFEDSANTADIRTLHVCLNWITLRSWKGLPFVYYWTILVGMASSAQAELRQERTFFAAEISRCIFNFGYTHRRIAADGMKNFLWLQATLRGERLPHQELTADQAIFESHFDKLTL